MRVSALCLALAAVLVAPPVVAPAAPPLDHIKRLILDRLGLEDRPLPQRHPPKEVVKQILTRAGDRDLPLINGTLHNTRLDEEPQTREIIAIAKEEMRSVINVHDQQHVSSNRYEQNRRRQRRTNLVQKLLRNVRCKNMLEKFDR